MDDEELNNANTETGYAGEAAAEGGGGEGATSGEGASSESGE